MAEGGAGKSSAELPEGAPELDKLSTPAQVAHNNLGLAACFGGTLFGKVAFNPSLRVIGSKPERGKLGAQPETASTR